MKDYPVVYNYDEIVWKNKKILFNLIINLIKILQPFYQNLIKLYSWRAILGWELNLPRYIVHDKISLNLNFRWYVMVKIFGILLQLHQ